jgi:hypothetical protein
MRNIDNAKLEGGAGAMDLFGPAFIQQFLVAARPELEALIRDVVEEGSSAEDVLCVPYGEAGRRIGTTYEGIRKLVKKGDLTPVSRGRRRGIAVGELKAYVERKKVLKQ